MDKITTNNELANYLSNGIQNIIADVISHTFQNPKETAFLLKYRSHSKKAEKTRTSWEEKGQHIPAFLISSITHSCNLFCKGCYARGNGGCHDNNAIPMLSDDEWGNIFLQASDLGIGFHLLAGGEPLLRRDVISKAASIENTIFPIFTNGTMIDDFYLNLFDKHRNLVPILSIEGSEETTDSRRGNGIYQQLINKMDYLHQNNILFGASITVTTENLHEVTSQSFIETLRERGCRLVFFIEYVPIDSKTSHLAFSDKERKELEDVQTNLRNQFNTVLFLSFPGDEKAMGGCLAAGRGFFHINPYGAAEACPFSPYSDCSLKDKTLLEVLRSPFFKRLQEERLVGDEHIGGCALFEKEDTVKLILSELK